MPLSEKDAGRLRDIIQYAQEAVDLVADLSEQAFCENRLLCLGVTAALK